MPNIASWPVCVAGCVWHVWQEWNHLSVDKKTSFTAADKVLHACLDPGRQVSAAQNLRHAIQKETKSVVTYVTRLERAFQIA